MVGAYWALWGRMVLEMLRKCVSSTASESQGRC